MGNLGFPELVVILIIILLLFGASKLPEIARALGRSVQEFKKGMKEDDEHRDKPASPSAPSS